LGQLQECNSLLGDGQNGHVGLLQALNGRKFNFLSAIAKRKGEYLREAYRI
jgi:hypothetical protein